MVWILRMDGWCRPNKGGECNQSSMLQRRVLRNLISMGVSQRIGLIPTAVGGTSIAAWSPPNGPQWLDMVSTVQAAMAAAGTHATLKGMIWVQVGQGGMG